MICFSHVSFTYPDAGTAALRDVDLTIPEGSFTLVAGATGSGKSTFLRCTNGLVPHFSGGRFVGRVSVAGRDTLEHPPRSLADAVAFVPQDPAASFVVERVEDEVAYALENLGVARATMRRRVEEMLDLLALDHLRTRSVGSLSGGEQQRVAIAAALAPGARVVALDEPTSQLDPQGAEDVLAGLHRLVHDLGITVVVAEHRLERVAGFADVVAACRDGRVEVGAPVEMLDRLKMGPPVAELGRALGWSPTPLTVREARRAASGIDLRPARVVDPETERETCLQARRISARYGADTAVQDVDLRLDHGDVLVVMGRNGAGKTTLLRVLGGIHQPSAGTVSLCGAPPSPGKTAAMCPQRPDALLFEETVEAEIAATLRPRLGRDPTGNDLAPWLEAVGLAHLRHAHPRDLSAGERLLVAVAAVAATDAPVLLLDEPTRGLDTPSKDRLVGFLRAHAARGAVVIATHDVELAAVAATRVVMLGGGEVIAVGTPAEVLADSVVFAPQVARVFGPPWLTAKQVVAAVAS